MSGIATKLAHLGPATTAPTFRLLLGHATGFCKEMWDPFVEDLGKLFSQDPAHFSASVIALDWSNHGDSRSTANPSAWDEFCPEDVFTLIDSPPSPSPTSTPPLSHSPSPSPLLVGVGHSMGGAGLCHAALRRPHLFSKLILFEPVLPEYSDDALKVFMDTGKVLSSTAMRRRGQWASRDEARAYFQSRPLMASWDPRSVEAYVCGAIRDTPDGCALKCAPHVEAQVYIRPPDVVNQLHNVSCPVHLLAGDTSLLFPASHWATLTRALPHGSFEMVPGSHFWPFEKPASFASLVYSHLSALAANQKSAL